MTENRLPVTGRIYEKGANRQGVHVYKITGPDISGTLFRFSITLNNEEKPEQTSESGNIYHIRKVFFNRLMDLNEDGWKRVSVSPADPEFRDFFDPERL